LAIAAATERIELSSRRAAGNYSTDGDIHPSRLRTEIKNFMQCEAILFRASSELARRGHLAG
jgi:hypothetical protein